MGASRIRSGNAGFTLIEVLIVVVSLSILAGAAIPQVADAMLHAKVSASLHAVTGVQRAVNENYVRTGAFPEKLDGAWFQPQSLPVNPFEPTRTVKGTKYVDGSKNSAKVHPSDKTTTIDIYWYNPKNGRFRMRVPWQGDATSTLALYNRANGTQLTKQSDVFTP
ncbi:MAG: prepilin-type N-terminal cleavage/methylation domain-containing protein [Planctomycetes bacterium]|nr:prepilin-type N-terminal cleavage/methylation domain-containing protein [Planctomycetota bacterium]